jgi:hypothetical protein
LLHADLKASPHKELRVPGGGASPPVLVAASR